MPDITDPQAIQFSNGTVRRASDLLARVYNSCLDASSRWVALGGGQTAIDVMENDIRSAAGRIMETYKRSFDVEKYWFIFGGEAMIPNTADPIIDGSASDGRPSITGSDAVDLVNRCIQIQNWLLSDDTPPSFTDIDRNSVAAINTVMAVTRAGKFPMLVTDAGNFINRCDELVANYQANSNANLNNVLSVSPNPT